MAQRRAPAPARRQPRRRGIGPALARTLLALCLSGGCGTAATAAGDGATYSPGELRAEAMAAASAGQPARALAMVEALLQRDPKDFSAYLIGSRARRNMGDTRGALADARMASKLARTDAEKYASTLVMAQALASAGRRTEAQLWLRWAADLAPNDHAKAIAMRDFRYVRSRNPLSVQLTFDVAPTSNINNGSSQDIVTLYGLPFSLSGAAQALSGTRYAAGAEFRWKLPATEESRSHVVASLFHQTYTLSSEAKAEAPGVSGSDFAYSSAALKYRQDRTAGAGRGLWGFDLAAGRNWYGGQVLSDFAELGIDRTIRAGKRGTLTFGGDVNFQQRHDGMKAQATAATLDASYSHRFRSGAHLRFDLGVTNSQSDDPSLDYVGTMLGAQYRLARPMLKARITFSGSVEFRDFPRSPYTTTGREDLSGRFGVEMLFQEAERWGFAPALTVNQSVRNSDVDLYDSDTLSVGLGIKSVF